MKRFKRYWFKDIGIVRSRWIIMPYKQVDVQTVGAAATVVNTEPIYGEIISIVVDYDALAAAGTDLIVNHVDLPIPIAALVPIFTLVNNNVDGCFNPRTPVVDVDEVAIDYDPINPPTTLVTDTNMSHGRLSISIAQAGAAVQVRDHIVYIIYKAESQQA